jgi:hypothetical protein
VPDRIEGTSLVFVNARGSDCAPGLVTRVNSLEQAMEGSEQIAKQMKCVWKTIM